MTYYNATEAIANQQRHPRKPIKGWEAYIGNKCIDDNNSVAILRARYQGNKAVKFKAVR
jgi:hypothetical protein